MTENTKQFLPKSLEAMEIYEYFTSQIHQFDYHLLKKWMQSENIEALAVIYGIITEREYSKKIHPQLSVWDYFYVIRKYFYKCLIEDHTDYWILSRFQAGMDLNNWFNTFWEDDNVPRKILKDFRDWLSKLYISEDASVKHCISNVVLGHLFETKEVRAFFSSWKEDQILKEAYSTAVELNL